jgi:hypothetical protein
MFIGIFYFSIFGENRKEASYQSIECGDWRSDVECRHVGACFSKL